ncbi:XRE family transcriptional regulator [Pseudomonas reactans]|nr:XRE family transcriptional regulator [Pseudomonas reactans]NWD81912.1 XRE family transcriptional regulator [Pseudomonas reactans]
MHSVRPCLIVFDDKDSWSDFCSSQIILIKKILISLGVGERLREERERLGKNQTDFGVSAGVSRGTQKAYELESSSPDVRYLSGLQELGVDVHYVLTGSRVNADLNNLSEVEAAVLGSMRQMSEPDRNVLLRTASAFASAAVLEGSKPPN